MFATADAGLAGAAGATAPPLNSFRHYRHLTLELAISQFKLRYTQSVLGYLWSLIKPASIFAITYFIFVDLFKINDGTKVYGMELLLGIVVWTFFAECTASSMQAIASNGGLIRKAYFPRSILVIAASLSSLFTFIINLLIVFVIAVALRDIDLGLRIVMVIPLLLELYAARARHLALPLSALRPVPRCQPPLGGADQPALLRLRGDVQPHLRAPAAAPGSGGRGHHKALPRTWSGSCRSWSPIPSCRSSRTCATRCSRRWRPWTELVVSGHLAAVKQYAPLNAAWEVPVPFLVVILVVIFGALTFRARARSFAENL